MPFVCCASVKPVPGAPFPDRKDSTINVWMFVCTMGTDFCIFCDKTTLLFDVHRLCYAFARRDTSIRWHVNGIDGGSVCIFDFDVCLMLWRNVGNALFIVQHIGHWNRRIELDRGVQKPTVSHFLLILIEGI